MSLALERRKKPKKFHVPAGTSFLVFVGLVLFLVGLCYYWPGFFAASLNTTDDVRLYYQGAETGEKALYQEEMLYLPLTFINEHLDLSLKVDEKNQLLVLTTTQNLYHFPIGNREGLLNLEPYEFTYPIWEKEGQFYVPADPFQDIYHLGINYYEEGSLVSIDNLQEPLLKGKVIRPGKIRVGPGLRSPWLNKVELNEEVNILREEQGWYWIENTEGKVGYIAKENVEITKMETQNIVEDVYQPWNPLGSPVVLTWDVARNGKMGELPGVQVLSPTWFELSEDGLILNKANKQYVEAAHSNGQQVWGLFSNSFDRELTHQFLHDADLRIKVMKQILSYVDLYELDGINLDFEDMHLKDKEAFAFFVAELAPLLHEKARVLTVDVTFHSQSENWSMCYDRKKLAEAADYLLVMGYDQYGAGSSVAGPVSSLPWVEKGIQNLLQEVPPDQVILGIPFYTRLWKEEKGEDGKRKVLERPKALTLTGVENWLKEKGVNPIFDEESGLNYVEVKEKEVVFRMWLEDDFSLAKRIELMKKYRLAGVAAWRHGYETQETWPTISQLVKKPQ